MTAFNPDALYVALDRARRNRRISWRELGRQAHVNPSMLTRLGRDKTIGADNLARVLVWLGNTDLAPYIHTGDSSGGTP